MGILQHVQILARLQDEFGIGQRPGDVDLLVSPQRILQAVQGEEVSEVPTTTDETHIDRGLAHTILDETRITSIDVAGSRLGFRGIDAAWLSHHASYASVARLLIDGELAEPDHEQSAFMAEGALLARTAGGLWDGTHSGLIAMLSRVEFAAPPPEDEACIQRQGWRLLGAAVQLAARTQEPVPLRDGIPEAICRSLHDTPDDAARALGVLMVLQADHGSSAAAVAVRTTISAGASLHHSMLAGMAAFGGHRHGGAIGDVVRLIESVPDLDQLRRDVRARLSAGTAVPGFGHRVYRTTDPRVEPIRRLLVAAEERRRSTWWSDRLRVIRDEHQHLERSGAVANVDFYAGPLLRVLGFDTASLTSLFAIARISGWIAHSVEQLATQTLIRPQLKYVGNPVKEPHL